MFLGHFTWVFIIPQSYEERVAQPVVVCPFQELAVITAERKKGMERKYRIQITSGLLLPA